MLTDSSGINNGSASSDTGTAVQKGERPVAVSKTSSTNKQRLPLRLLIAAILLLPPAMKQQRQLQQQPPPLLKRKDGVTGQKAL